MSDEIPLADQRPLANERSSSRQFRRLADGQATPEEFQAIEA
ncbi:MAG: hypothetical protein JWN70_6559, partial [Planctomycetaceae bacterium]|nr:hypothetical protein [Planctomycetaceae bacterium]